MIDAERVKELRGLVEDYRDLSRIDYIDLLAVLDSYSALKAELTTLKAEREELGMMHKGTEEARYKLEVEVERLSGDLAKALVNNHAVALETEKNLRTKAEAELERQRPLVEAVMGAGLWHHQALPGMKRQQFFARDEEAILRAAQKLRSEISKEKNDERKV